MNMVFNADEVDGIIRNHIARTFSIPISEIGAILFLSKGEKILLTTQVYVTAENGTPKKSSGPYR